MTLEEARPEACYRKSFTSFISLWSLGSNCQKVYPTLESKTSKLVIRVGFLIQAELVMKLGIKGS